MVCSVFYLQKGLPSGGLFAYHQLEDKIVFSAQAICTGESQRGEIIMRKTAKAMALLTAASMIMTAFTPVYVCADMEQAFYEDFYGRTVKEAGVQAPLEFVPAGVSVTLRENEAYQYLFIQNFAREPKAVPVPAGYEVLYGTEKEVLAPLETRILKRSK